MIVSDELHKLRSHLSANSKILELGIFEVGNFGRKISFFANFDFLATGGDRGTCMSLNESQDLRVYMVKTVSDI